MFLKGVIFLRKIRRQTKITALLLVIIIAFYFTLSYVQIEKKQEIDYNFEYGTEEPNISSQKRYNIFFIESDSNRNHFTWKDICSIESAAFHNPNAMIYVYSLSAKFDKFDLTNRYSNINIRYLNIPMLFNQTPLMSWWQNGAIKQSSYKTVHLSDALRLALLYKYGGFYSDTDTITLKSFSDLMNYNGFGYLDEKKPYIGNILTVVYS